MPKISVIMPVYKTEATVAAAIESVLSQTFADFELLCVDDGSPDKAGETLAAYAAKDSRVRVFTQENRGLSGARNTGLEQAVGEYVTFLDSDDALPRHALATFLSAAEQTGAAVVVSERPVDVETDEAKREAIAVETAQAQAQTNPDADALLAEAARAKAEAEKAKAEAEAALAEAKRLQEQARAAAGTEVKAEEAAAAGEENE